MVVVAASLLLLQLSIFGIVELGIRDRRHSPGMPGHDSGVRSHRRGELTKDTGGDEIRQCCRLRIECRLRIRSITD